MILLNGDSRIMDVRSENFSREQRKYQKKSFSSLLRFLGKKTILFKFLEIIPIERNTDLYLPTLDEYRINEKSYVQRRCSNLCD